MSLSFLPLPCPTLQIFTRQDNQPRILGVMSCLAGEGKTSLVLALGRLLANSGIKTLVVDGDFRKPSLHRFIDVSPLASVAEIILGKRNADTAITRDPKTQNLSLLVGQPSAQQDMDNLSKQAIETALNRFKDQYEVILVDTPSFVAVAESRLLLQACEANIFVARWDYVPVKVVQSVLKHIRNDSDITLKGFVLTRVDESAYKQYDYSTAYYAEAHKKAA